MTAISILPLIFTLLSLAIPIILIVLIFKAYKKHTNRVEERLNIEKQQTFNLQKQVEELNKRMNKIESLLKEVD